MRSESFPVLKLNGSIDVNEWINEIIEMIFDMEPGDDILVFDFGKQGNLFLMIDFDNDYDISIAVNIDMLNIYKSNYIYRGDDDIIQILSEELEAIWKFEKEIN